MGGTVKGRQDWAHVGPATPATGVWAKVRHRYSEAVRTVVDHAAEAGITHEDLALLALADAEWAAERIAELLEEDRASNAVAMMTAHRTAAMKLAAAQLREINPQSTPNTRPHTQPASVSERRARRAPSKRDTGDELVN